ncbi:GrpB family protein [Halosolutus amylolyticus]|uniref:GrpB family protein n=1 Tax=Halosolutus amylolyticus TaxID=2932267 RepID=A0ABD5PRJ9_9EURY|nr:GrpB family protein [Halosolutus amylolyticus]
MVGLERGTVELEPFREEWKELYNQEIARLKDIAGDRFLEFEHIGSTAIEGMPAKPIIDILAVVEDLDEAEDLIPLLEEHRYEYRPGDIEGRLFFAKGPRTNRTFYLSLTEQGSDFYTDKIAFREYLREHPEAAEQYASLKKKAAEKYPKNREKYTAEKGDCIQDILDRAMNE